MVGIEWVCGYVGAWLGSRGYVGMWVWVCGWECVGKCGYVGVWLGLRGYVGMWVCGCVGVSVCVPVSAGLCGSVWVCVGLCVGEFHICFQNACGPDTLPIGSTCVLRDACGIDIPPTEFHMRPQGRMWN